MSTTICAGCSSPSGPFAATCSGVAIKLCSDCAARLLRGESKDKVIRAISKTMEKAA